MLNSADTSTKCVFGAASAKLLIVLVMVNEMYTNLGAVFRSHCIFYTTNFVNFNGVDVRRLHTPQVQLEVLVVLNTEFLS